MTYKKTLKHRFLEWQLLRAEKAIEKIDKKLKWTDESKWKRQTL